MRGLVRSDNREVMRCCCMVTKWGYRKTGNSGAVTACFTAVDMVFGGLLRKICQQKGRIKAEG